MVNFFQEYKLTDLTVKPPVTAHSVLLNRNNQIRNVEDVLGETGPNPADSAVTHLFNSIGELKADTNEIDAKILGRITNDPMASVDRSGRMTGLSA